MFGRETSQHKNSDCPDLIVCTEADRFPQWVEMVAAKHAQLPCCINSQRHRENQLCLCEGGGWMDEVAGATSTLVYLQWISWKTLLVLADTTPSMLFFQPRWVEWICTLAVSVEPCSLSPDAWQRLVSICHPLPAERPLRFMWHKLNHVEVKILPDSQLYPGYIVEETESSFLRGEVTENGVFSLFPDAFLVMYRAAARPG